MSYLDVPRLHFFGSFFANPSTNNNNRVNYSLRMPFEPPDWNPDGSHTFMLGPPRPPGVELPDVERYFPCTVTGIATGSGSGGADAILGATVRTPNYALLVDLDTDQQWVSQIIGSTLRIEQGADAIIAKLPTVNFVDIFQRVLSDAADDVYRGKDSKWCAAYQTVLTDVEWSDWPDSPFVRQLRDATSPGMLSIRFVVDGYHTNQRQTKDKDGNPITLPSITPLFRYGRLAGTIGPWREGEPHTFVNARYLRPVGKPTLFGAFNYAPAKTDRKRKVITFDLGNAVPAIWPEGADFPIFRTLPAVGAYVDFGNEKSPSRLGYFDLSQKAYETNAYVQEFTVDDDQLEALRHRPTIIMVDPGVTVLRENDTGAYANFDQYVFRLNKQREGVTRVWPDRGVVDLWANRFEQPAAEVTIPLIRGLVPTMDYDEEHADGQRNGIPPEAIQFPSSVITDKDGHARFEIKAENPRNPRKYLDGQVYGVLQKWSEDTRPNPKIGVSVKIFDDVDVPKNPTWEKDVFPILNEFAVLYPAMRLEGRINLSDYDQVVANIAAIRERTQLPWENTGYMPITRELSNNKRQIILNWADNGCPKEPKK